MTKTKLDWALAARAKGLPVFALTWTDEAGNCSCGDSACKKQGKHPIANSSGWKDAIWEEADIIALWTAYPHANIGVYPGAHWVIIDLDLKNGKNGLATFCEATGLDAMDAINAGFVVQTTTGGYHLYYRTTEPFGCSVGLLDGVDVRAVGGYVLAAGSVIGNKAYEIYNDEEPINVADRPSVVMMLKKPRERKTMDQTPVIPLDLESNIERAAEWLRTQAKPAVLGSGNRTMFEVAGFVKDIGISFDKCVELMWEHYNPRCEPPWTREEAETFMEPIDSMYKRGQNAPGSKGSTLIDAMLAGGGFEDTAGMAFEEPGTVSAAPAASTGNRFEKLISSGIGVLESTQKREYIIPQWFLAHGFTAIMAERGAGKTVIMLDIALRIAHEMNWQDWPVTSEPWCVAYVCGEDSVGLREQIKAWHIKNGKEGPPDKFILIDGIMDLSDETDVTNLCHAIARKVGLDAEGRPIMRVILIVDTWQRATAGVSQNDDKDMQPAVRNIERIAAFLRGPALVAFHPPKQNKDTIAGSAVIENSSTAIWKLEETTGSKRKLQVTRIKGKGDGCFREFDFVEQPIYDKDGKPIMDDFGQPESGVVPVKCGGRVFGMTSEAAAQQDVALSNEERIILAELIYLIGFKGMDTMGATALADALKDSAKACSLAQDTTSETGKLWAKYPHKARGKNAMGDALTLHFAKRASEPFEYGKRGSAYTRLEVIPSERVNGPVSYKLAHSPMAMAAAPMLPETVAPMMESKKLDVEDTSLYDTSEL